MQEDKFASEVVVILWFTMQTVWGVIPYPLLKLNNTKLGLWIQTQLLRFLLNAPISIYPMLYYDVVPLQLMKSYMSIISQYNSGGKRGEDMSTQTLAQKPKCSKLTTLVPFFTVR